MNFEKKKKQKSVILFNIIFPSHAFTRMTFKKKLLIFFSFFFVFCFLLAGPNGTLDAFHARHLKFKRFIWNCCWRTLESWQHIYFPVGTHIHADHKSRSVCHSPLIGLTRFCCTTRTPSANSLKRTNMHNAQNMLALEFHLTAITIPCVCFFSFLLNKSVFLLFFVYLCGKMHHRQCQRIQFRTRCLSLVPRIRPFH